MTRPTWKSGNFRFQVGQFYLTINTIFMANFNNTRTTLQFQFDDKICSILDFFRYKYISKLSFTKSYYIFQKIDIAFAFQILKFYMIFIYIYIKRFCFLFSHLLNFLPHSHKMMYTGNHESTLLGFLSCQLQS